MEPRIAPSILSANFSKIEDEVKAVTSAGADMLHLDVMDGHFVPNITFGPKMVRDMRSITDVTLDVHLMISEPEKYVENFAKAGADWISVHYEAADHLNRLVNQVKDCGCKAGVVINPATPVELLSEILPYADFVLLMSVNPGFGGQKFISTSVQKAKKLKQMSRELNPALFIEMDGGISTDNIKSLKEAGVDVFVAGNSIFAAKDPSRALADLKKQINS